MIEVKAQLYSAISPTRDDQLCRVQIVNVQTNARGSRADYEVRLFSRDDKLIRMARVENWPRKAKPAWRLVQAAMAALDE